MIVYASNNLKKIKAIRGMNDLLPEQAIIWQAVESQVRQLLSSHGYGEIRMPIVESTILFKRSIGEVTDIVEKEMYTFEDRNGDSLTLRPEGTACCVRACEEHGLLYNQTQRLWYAGPMFRHERPQKGRYRQFHQIGVETFGMVGPDIDAELIMMTAQLWEKLGIQDAVTLQINSLGTAEARAAYKSQLVEYLTARKEELDEDSQKRLTSNPLRVLDSKNPQTQTVLDGAPKLIECLDEESKQHFDDLLEMLNKAGIAYEINTRLVRGLDYYGRTVFEWVTDKLGAQGTVCAGGRYDGLVEQLGGKATPAVGFAMGMERLVLLMETLQQTEGLKAGVDIYIVAVGDKVYQIALLLAKTLRESLANISVQSHCGGGSFKSQLKKADKSGAQYAVILGEEEVEKATVTLKPLRGQGEQIVVGQTELVSTLTALLS